MLSVRGVADAFVRLLVSFFFFLVEMLAVTFDLTVALSSMGALTNLLAGFTPMSLVGIDMDFSALSTKLFDNYKLVFFDGFGLLFLSNIFGWVADFSGWFSGVFLDLDLIFYEVNA